MTGPDEEGKPTGSGYALVDWRLSRIEAQLSQNAADSVPIGIYNVNQQNITAKLAELQLADTTEASARAAAVKELDTKMDAFESKQSATKDAVERNRKQFWATLAAGALLLILQLVGNPIGTAIANALVQK